MKFGDNRVISKVVPRLVTYWLRDSSATAITITTTTIGAMELLQELQCLCGFGDSSPVSLPVPGTGRYPTRIGLSSAAVISPHVRNPGHGVCQNIFGVNARLLSAWRGFDGSLRHRVRCQVIPVLVRREQTGNRHCWRWRLRAPADPESGPQGRPAQVSQNWKRATICPARGALNVVPLLIYPKPPVV